MPSFGSIQPRIDLPLFLARARRFRYIPRVDEGLTSNQLFPTTRWTLIATAAGVEPDQREKVLEELYQTYWSPIYAFIRSNRAVGR
ncbi:MAG: hypothetical protein MI807_18300 [Verrucomicrobiales bacterium]|nr:hypothetical protein [Verrucomicrobiales bacterium]